jgi:hypothetical protein
MENYKEIYNSLKSAIKNSNLSLEELERISNSDSNVAAVAQELLYDIKGHETKLKNHNDRYDVGPVDGDEENCWDSSLIRKFTKTSPTKRYR